MIVVPREVSERPLLTSETNAVIWRNHRYQVMRQLSES